MNLIQYLTYTMTVICLIHTRCTFHSPRRLSDFQPKERVSSSHHESCISNTGDHSELITGDQSECLSSSMLVCSVFDSICWIPAELSSRWECWSSDWHELSGWYPFVVCSLTNRWFLWYLAFYRKPAWPEYEYPRQGAPMPSCTASATACSTKPWSSQ